MNTSCSTTTNNIIGDSTPPQIHGATNTQTHFKSRVTRDYS